MSVGPTRFLTVAHSMAQSYLQATAVRAGAAAAAAETRKESKYAGLQGRVAFSAVAFETLGPIGPSAIKLLDGIAERIRLRTGDTGARDRLYRRLAAAVQLGNAACIIEAHSRNASCAEAHEGARTAPRHRDAFATFLLKTSARSVAHNSVN